MAGLPSGEEQRRSLHEVHRGRSVGRHSGHHVVNAGQAVAAGATAAVPYSEARLAALRAQGQVVFVDMTADWCITCKANEKAVLARDGFRDALRDANATYMVGDYTDVDPAITAYLQRYRAVGVPLYVVYPRGGGEGRVLPTVLSPELVSDALADAAK